MRVNTGRLKDAGVLRLVESLVSGRPTSCWSPLSLRPSAKGGEASSAFTSPPFLSSVSPFSLCDHGLDVVGLNDFLRVRAEELCEVTLKRC